MIPNKKTKIEVQFKKSSDQTLQKLLPQSLYNPNDFQSLNIPFSMPIHSSSWQASKRSLFIQQSWYKLIGLNLLQKIFTISSWRRLTNQRDNSKTSGKISLYISSSSLARAALGLEAWAIVVAVAAATWVSNSFYKHSNSNADLT